MFNSFERSACNVEIFSKSFHSAWIKWKRNRMKINEYPWKSHTQQRVNFPTPPSFSIFRLVQESDAFQPPWWKVKEIFSSHFYRVSFSFQRKNFWGNQKNLLWKSCYSFVPQYRNFPRKASSRGREIRKWKIEEGRVKVFHLTSEERHCETSVQARQELCERVKFTFDFSFDWTPFLSRVLTPKFTSYKHMCGLRSLRTRNSPSKRTSLRWGDSCFCY